MSSLNWKLKKLNYRILKHYDAGMNSFHKTDFTYSESWRMLLGFLIWYIGMNFVIDSPVVSGSITNAGTMEVINFLVLELLPVLVIGIFCGRMPHDGTLWRRIGSFMWTWLKRFAVGIWRHKAIVIGLILFMLILEDGLNAFIAQVVFNGELKPNTNNLLILKLMKQNKVMFIATSLIAPLTEELVFRFWMTSVFRHGIARMLQGKMPRLASCLGAIASAIVFAGMHLHAGENMALGVVYIVIGLYLQWVMSRTHSLVAPVLVHGVSNALLMGLKLSV